MISIFKQVIFRFQPLIFQGVYLKSQIIIGYRGFEQSNFLEGGCFLGFVWEILLFRKFVCSLHDVGVLLFLALREFVKINSATGG